MARQTTQENSFFVSPLASSGSIRPQGGRRMGLREAKVILTPLIDAFSILVIYLLMSFSTTGEILRVSEETELPSASQVDTLNMNTIIKIEKDQMFVDEEKIQSSRQLLQKLVHIRKKLENKANPAIIIQADRRIQFKGLNNVVLAAGHAGFSELHFAVLSR